MTSKPKLKNGEAFRKKTGSLRKLLKNYADFHYVTAPHIVLQASAEEASSEEIVSDQRGWWFTSEEHTYNSKEYSKITIGFEDSLQCVEAALQEEGPFDGVLGFSQGAAFLSLLCSLQQQGGLQGSFKFALFFAGFKSRCTVHQEYYRKKINLPSMHVFGETDAVIPGEMSKDLSSCFDSPLTVLHTGGHYVPASGPQKDTYTKFMEHMSEAK